MEEGKEEDHVKDGRDEVVKDWKKQTLALDRREWRKSFLEAKAHNGMQKKIRYGYRRGFRQVRPQIRDL